MIKNEKPKINIKNDQRITYALMEIKSSENDKQIVSLHPNNSIEYLGK